jgi:hypothetical protein
MYIIDKNKDYYDHFSYIYGIDKAIVFDRRNSVVVDDDKLVTLSVYHRAYRDDKNYLLLEAGSIQYLFGLHEFELDNYNDVLDYSIRLVKIFRDHKHYFDSPLSLRRVSLPYIWLRSKLEDKEDIDFSELHADNDRVVNLPILKDCKLTSLIDAEEIWRELQNYLSSMNNESKVDNMSDIEKVESHGFDKKTSFRSNKK